MSKQELITTKCFCCPGKWAFEEPKENPLTGDLGLILTVSIYSTQTNSEHFSKYLQRFKWRLYMILIGDNRWLTVGVPLNY